MKRQRSDLSRRIRRIRRKFFLLVTVPTAVVTLSLIHISCLSACGQSSLLAPGTYSSSSQLFHIPNNIVESFLLVKGLMVFLQHLPVFQLPLVQYLCGSLQPFFRIPVENFLEPYRRSRLSGPGQSLVKLPVPALCILGSCLLYTSRCV